MPEIWVRDRRKSAKPGQSRWIDPGADGFVVCTAVVAAEPNLRPGRAIIVRIRVKRIGTTGEVRSEGALLAICATAILVSNENRIEASLCDCGGNVFPKRFAALRVGSVEDLPRYQTPDRSDVHYHDPASTDIVSDVEFTLARLSG